jgi:hypothetical protein
LAQVIATFLTINSGGVAWDSGINQSDVPKVKKNTASRFLTLFLSILGILFLSKLNGLSSE